MKYVRTAIDDLVNTFKENYGYFPDTLTLNTAAYACLRDELAPITVNCPRGITPPGERYLAMALVRDFPMHNTASLTSVATVRVSHGDHIMSVQEVSY